jgi:hypothetical protein
MRSSSWFTRLVIAMGFCFLLQEQAFAQAPTTQSIDPRIWSQSYWQKLAERGLVEVAKPAAFIPPAPSAPIAAMPGAPVDSRDVPVTPLTNVTQSENSVFVHPNDLNTILNSNNSTSWPVTNLFGASGFVSEDGGATWRGQVNGTGGDNNGDPTTAIDRTGRFFVGYIAANGGQGVARSLNRGQTWTHVQAAATRGASLLDKNHLWVDNSPTSPFQGNLYSAWTMFGGPNDAQIEIARSTDGGLSWSNPITISRNVNAGSHNQGVNIQTGPNGEVYVMWAIYDFFPADETALGFALSRDGGATYEPSRRIITNIRGIRSSATSKNMRVVAFPVMAADISNTSRRGTLYAVWTNRGAPGVNTGNDIDGYLIKSTDHGATWSSPVRINQDAPNLGKQHFFQWITCDPANGNLSVIYYDDRNVPATDCETFVSNSQDGGVTWTDFRVSDVSFRPTPIPGLASGYFGDYLGITALGGKVYPCWTDNRDGRAMTYVSPFVLEIDSIPPAAVTDLSASLPTSNSITLQWTAHGDDGDSGRAAGYDIRYALAPLDSLAFDSATRAPNRIVPQLPGAIETFEVTGLNFNTTYYFAVKVVDEQGNASPVSNSPSATTLGEPRIAVSPDSLAETLLTGAQSVQTLTIRNIGEGTLDFKAEATGVFEGRTSFALKPRGAADPKGSTTKAADETTEGSAIPLSRAGVAAVDLPFYDGFEDGDFSDWTDGGGFGVKEVTNTTAAKGQYSFHYQYTGGNGHFHGIHQDLTPGSQPDYASFYVRPGANNLSAGYFTLYTNGGTTGAIFFFARSTGFFYVNADVGGNESFPYNALQWYHVEFKNIDFTGKTFDYYVDGNLIQAAIPFRNAAVVNDIDRLYLYNFSSNSEAWWDEIRLGSGAAPVNWLSVAPDSGRVQSEDSFDLQVTFDATGLDGGGYDGQILITSNDTANAVLRVPAHLQVIGAPDIDLSATFLDFDSVLVSDTLQLKLEVFNLGTDVLNVNITARAPFAAAPDTFSLLPRTSQIVDVAFLPTTIGVFEDSLIFASNDPDEARVAVPMRGVSLPPPEISVAPSRLDESLFVGQTSQQTLTISNTGQSNLSYALSFENAQVRLSSLRPERKGEEASAETPATETIDAETRAALGEELLKLARAAAEGIEFPAKLADEAEGLPPAMLEKFRKQLEPYAQLVKRVNQTAALPSLAVGGFNSASLLSVLLSLSNSVKDYAYTDIGDNFTLATLNQFDGVIVDERDFRLTLAEAEALRDYSASGKPVFIGMDDFDNLTPQVQAVIFPVLGVSAAFDRDFAFGSFNPNHPITQNLTTMEFFNSSDNDYFTLAGADWLFADPFNNYFGTAYQSRNRTVLFGESLFAIVLNNPNNLLLFSNALDWVVAGSTGWVTLDKTTSIVAPGVTDTVTATFSAVGLRGGDYTADLVVASNDPDEKRTIVPVHLVITNAPDIATASDTLDFGEVFIGVKDSLFAVVTNAGTFDLLITSAVAAPEVFTVTPPYAGVNPGEKENFKVRFAPVAPGDYAGTLTLINNDPDENPKVITLLGKGVTPPVIAVAPDSFAFALNSGDSASAVMTISNNGGSDLNFTLRDLESGGGNAAGQFLFWSQEYQAGPDTIFRSNLDGADIRPVYIGNLQSGYGSIAYHPGEGRIYSSEYAEGRIFSVKVDGSDPRILVTGVPSAFDLILDLGAGHMYWTEFQTGVIKRANLDGTGVGIVVQSFLPGPGNGPAPENDHPKLAAGNISALNGPWGLDLDLAARKIYWSEPNSNRIARANFDGTVVETVSLNVGFPLGVKLDASAGKIYFVEGSSGNIGRMDLSGANQEVVLQTFSATILDFKLDVPAKKFYWSNYATDQITRANFDGSNVTVIVTRLAFGADGPFAVGLTGGSNWLFETPAQGTVAAGSSLPVTLDVKSKGLFGGDYRATIFINSNDPLTSEVQVPVTLQVTGVPIAEIAPDTVDFGQVFVNLTGKETVSVTNAGTANLLVSNVQISPAVFAYADSMEFTLPPGAIRELAVSFTPEAAQSYSGALTFATNDSKQPNVSVALLGEGVIAPVIAASPDSLCDSLNTGESSVQTLTLRNDGGSALAWSATVDFTSASAVVSQSPRFDSKPMKSKEQGARGEERGEKGEGRRAMGDERWARGEERWAMSEEREAPFTLHPSPFAFHTSALEQPLDSTLAKLNRNFEQVNGAIPNRYDFFEGESGSFINDGGNDMYDGGNFLGTNLGAPVFYSNNLIVASPIFGASGRYFTRKYPGLFLLVADLDNVSDFTIDGNLGADGGGNVDGAILEAALFGATYQGFVKRVFNAGDPSVNHLIIIAKNPAATHEFSTNTDLDFHAVHNLNGATRLYYLLYAGANGSYIDNSATLNIFDAFLSALDLLPPWLTLDPASGVIAPNASQEVQATFDATGLAGGNYRAKIALASNDPVTPLLQVPACLNVTGAAVIQVSDSTLFFGDVFVAGSKILSFGVKNTGSDTLEVSDIAAVTSVFSAAPKTFKLGPGQEQKVLARFAPNALGPANDVLTITSNAQNLPQTFVEVSGNGVPPPVIAVAPDSFSFLLDVNQTATEVLTLANNGGSPLTYSIRDEEQSRSLAPGSGKKLYWSNLGTSRPPSQIMRSDADGANVETIFSGSANVRGIAIDEQHGRLYWCDSFLRGILSSTLTGDSVTVLVRNLVLPVGITLDVEGDRMYWADFSGGNIGRAKLDGSEVTVLITGAANPRANPEDEAQFANATANSIAGAALAGPFEVTLDLENDQIYWTELNGNRIARANLDGTNIETVLSSPNTNNPRGIRLDVANNKIYYLDAGTDRIRRANFDGTNLETLLTLPSLAFLELLELDLSEGKMYWSDFGQDNIARANLDGTGLEVLHQAPNSFDSYGVALLSTGWLSESPLSGTVPPGASESIAITVNTNNLVAGDYDASVIINSNDPVDSVKTVPVHLRVRSSDVFLALADSSFGVPRDTVAVPVSVDFSNPLALAALQASIKLSNTNLAFLSYTPGPIVSRGLRVAAPSPDSVSVTFASEGGQYLNQSGVLATLHFRIAESATPGQTTSLRFLNLSAADSAGVAPTLAGSNGFFFARKAPEVSGNVKYARVTGGGNSAKPVPELAAVLSRNGVALQEQTTNTTGNYLLPGILPRTNYRVEVQRASGGLGSAITPTDALLAFNGYLGNITLTGAQNLAADVDADLNITPGDALAIFNRFLGVINQYPAADWRTFPASYAIDGSATAWKTAPTGIDYPVINNDQLNQDYVAVGRGDVDLSWTSTSAAAFIVEAQTDEAAANAVVFKLEQARVAPGTDKILVPIVLNGVAVARGVYAFGGELQYASTQLQITAVHWGATALQPEFRVSYALTQAARVSEAGEAEDETKLTGGLRFGGFAGTGAAIRQSGVLMEVEARLLGNVQAGAKLLLRLHETSAAIGASSVALQSGASFEAAAVSVEQSGDLVLAPPATFALLNNYPNPFNPETELRYQLPEAASVSLTIFNALGQRVRTLVHAEKQESGYYRRTWDGKNEAGEVVSAGVYFYRLEAHGASAKFQRTNKMLMLK